VHEGVLQEGLWGLQEVLGQPLQDLLREKVTGRGLQVFIRMENPRNSHEKNAVRDAELSAVLRQWCLGAEHAPAPRFEEKVWGRIARRGNPPASIAPWWEGVWNGWTAFFARPAGVLWAVVPVGVGMLIGGMQARRDAPRDYVASLQPRTVPGNSASGERGIEPWRQVPGAVLQSVLREP
jgi:hypothetical protein